MRLSPIVVALLVLGGVVGEARAFTYENERGDVSGSSPRFVDPAERSDPATEPSATAPFSLRSRDPSDRRDPYGYDPTYIERPLPPGARIGAGDHGFDNYNRYRAR